jgi:hypothetical protein
MMQHGLTIEAIRERTGGWANMMFARYGHPVWLVGSLVEGKVDPTDIDVRIVMPDDEFIGRFGQWSGVRSVAAGDWSEENLAWARTIAKESAWLARKSGINVDFKIRSQSWYDERHSCKPRVRLDACGEATRLQAGQ